MSHRYDVLRAIGDLFRVVLPRAEVLGIDDDGDNADEVGRDGRVIVRSGDPGEPIVDLSPLTYNWTHRIPVEAVFRTEADLDAAVTLLGAAIVADRQLGGLCEWVEILAPSTEGLFAEGISVPRAAEIVVIAMYPTTSPTG